MKPPICRVRPRATRGRVRLRKTTGVPGTLNDVLPMQSPRMSSAGLVRVVLPVVALDTGDLTGG